MRIVWLLCGLTSLSLGGIGIILPILPTTPFLLLAAFCFARSSERLHHWLLNHRIFGPLIVDWQERGAIHPRAKGLATLSIIAVVVLSLVIGWPVHILIIQGIALSLVLLFIWTRPNY